ncbi:MAG: TrbG/VirB9 family P-type conjugative transfer protein [Pseudomonadota bacterium]|nr:TrbG/VirB9 family P-type conjugative transfer protein [Pseudomonadota bacterium]
MKYVQSIILVLTMLLGMSGIAFADAQAYPMPTDNHLVEFQYDPDQTYTILAIPDAVTDIQIGKDETLIGPPAIGDSIEWKVAVLGRHIFIKPVRNNLFTSMTIVTNKRAYQLTLRSSPTGGKWYQHVSWQYPDIIISNLKIAQANIEKSKQEKQRLSSINVSAVPDYTNLNFDYSVSGDDDLKPTTVFDDGKFTYIRLKQSMQEMPALFIDENGKSELVNYNVHGEYLVVQRTAARFVLKLGKQEVHLTNNKLNKRFFHSFW